MAINLYDFHDIIRETYNEYVSRYEIDLVDFKNEYGTDSEPKFIEYQRVYLGKMRDYIIENLSKIDNEDLDSQFYHDKLQEALSDNKKMFHFLNVRLNPMNYIPEQKENTSSNYLFRYFNDLNNGLVSKLDMINYLKSYNSIEEFEALLEGIEEFDKNYYAENLVYNLNKRDLSESFTTFKELVLSKIDELKNLEITSNKKQKKDYTKNVWFKVGLLYAENKLEKYIEECESNGKLSLKAGYSGIKVAEELGDIRYEKYIMGPIGGYKGGKNVFDSIKNMEIIINYCEENKIEVCGFFIQKYNEKVRKLK